MSTTDFRHLARKALERAKIELASGVPQRTRYAALELREAMEALTYDRALSYKDEISPEEYKIWQPRRVMEYLLEIEPSVGIAATLSIGTEKEFGKSPPPEDMVLLGTDTPLSMKDIKQHYNALGSYLHVPSLDQATSGQVPDLVKLQGRCNEIVAVIDKVLRSPVWNATFGNFATLPECMNVDCKKPIKKRLPLKFENAEARCFECNAEYTITRESDGKVCWKPKQILVKCNKCDGKIPLWPNEVRPGIRWRCTDCKTLNQIVLAIADVSEISDIQNGQFDTSKSGDASLPPGTH